jgi:hypothetical protein
MQSGAQRPSRYVRDDDLREEIAPHLSRPAFATARAVLEREEGFPKVDPLFKGRYLPGVLAYLERRAGLQKTIVYAPDGAETWGDDHANSIGDARPAKAQAQRRSGRSLLERREPEQESRSVPRSVDPFTQRRHARIERPLFLRVSVRLNDVQAEIELLPYTYFYVYSKLSELSAEKPNRNPAEPSIVTPEDYNIWTELETVVENYTRKVNTQHMLRENVIIQISRDFVTGD